MTEEQKRKQEILDAAFEEFANKGFRGSTIKSIAKMAGLKSPSLIYWYFPTKEELFQAVLSSRSQFLQDIMNAEVMLDQPPELVLSQLAHGYLQMLHQPVLQKMMRLIFSEFMKRQALADMLAEKVMMRVLGFLQVYFERQIEMGRLRPHDVMASSRAFMGLLVPQAFGIVLFPILRETGPDDEAYIAVIIDIFLTGLQNKS